jgi:hypothetical protein
MDPVTIFVSHSSKYCSIAKSLRISLQALETSPLLDIKISEEMAGATDWREWIEENVKRAKIFLLLYPHVSMEMGWSNYELGRFYDRDRHVVCIKNTDISVPPPAFEPYQAYSANESGLLKFLNELFVLGRFTDGQPVNAAVGKVTDPLYGRAKEIANALAKEFTDARVRQQLYERHLVMSIHYDSGGKFDRDASTIEGNPEGLRLLGFDTSAVVRWSDVTQLLGTNDDWASELEKALQTISTGALPPTLPPFRVQAGMFIPVIAKTDTVDAELRKIDVMFVEASPDRLRPLLDWSLPTGMPDGLAYLIRIFRMVFRARWEILQPRYQEVTYRKPSLERCAELARSVIEGYDQMRVFAESEEMQGVDKFNGAFRKELRPEMEKASAEWTQLMNALRSEPIKDGQTLGLQLKQLLDNNAKWLDIGARQFSFSIADLV